MWTAGTTRSARSRLGAAVIGALLTAGCFAAPTVDVRYDAGAAHLVVGEVLRVTFGEVNPSIGDSWHLVGEPDPAVLGRGTEDYESDCRGAAAGCGGQLSWTFPASGKGTTTVVFRYCYRSRPGPECMAEPSRGPADPVTLTVTVR
jgi:predicted secreted protein